MRQTEEFTPLRIVRKNLTDSNRCAYRVFKSPDEYVTVEAATALEAFRESGIANPYRILRETRFMERLVDQSKFSDNEDLIETGMPVAASDGFMQDNPPSQKNPVEMQNSPSAFVANEQAKDETQAALKDAQPAEEILSPDDISKLLEGQ